MVLKNGLAHQILMKEEEIPLPTGENKKIIGLIKDERGSKILQTLQQQHQKYMVTEHKKMIMK